MITIEYLSEPDLNWNKRLLDSKYGTIYQTKEIAQYFEKTSKFKNSFLQFLDQSGTIVGQILLSKHNISKNKSVKGILKNFLLKNNSLYRWVYGPVIFDESKTYEINEQLFFYLKSKKTKIFGSEHPLLSGSFFNSKTSCKIKNWSTFLIDLSLSKEELWKNCDKHSARKNVERSLKRNVIVKEITKNDLKYHHSILADTKAKVGHKSLLSNIEIQWDLLHPLGFTGFLAWKDGLPVGSIMVSFFNNYVNEWGVARSDLDRDEKLYSQDLIKWKIIEWGNNNKFRYFDLTGANPNPKNSKEEGIFRYKKKWGGNMIQYDMVNS